MLSIKLVYIYVLLFIIFITLCFTLNILLSKNTDIIANTNIISMIAIIIMIIFVIYCVFTHKPENRILKEYDNKIKLEKNYYLDNNLIKKKYNKRKCNNRPKIIKKTCNTNNEDNYQNLLHSEYIDELENEFFYKTKDDYHNIEKHVYENYLSLSK
jgi:magnesium-transporting ATPase (P-type)